MVQRRQKVKVSPRFFILFHSTPVLYTAASAAENKLQKGSNGQGEITEHSDLA